MPAISFWLTRSAIFFNTRSWETWYGSSVTTMAVRPGRISATSATALTLTEPRPVTSASFTASSATICPPEGKSGPLTYFRRSAGGQSGLSRR